MKPGLAAVLILVALGGGFFGGLTYQKSKGVTADMLQNLTQDQRRQLFAGGAGGFAGGAAGGRAGGAGRGGAAFGGGVNAVMGEVLSKDATSFTVKLRDGGSKIVFYSASTTVAKMDSGAIGDVAVGKNVMVSGTTNSDGSVTATMVQIRPALPPGATPAAGAPAQGQR
jgi:hypothetical protein